MERAKKCSEKLTWLNCKLSSHVKQEGSIYIKKIRLRRRKAHTALMWKLRDEKRWQKTLLQLLEQEESPGKN